MIRLKLKELLKRHGIRPVELANAVEGLSPKTVYLYIAGQRNPSLDALDRVISALRRLTDEPIEVGDVIEFR